jgi:hypothetical protein
MKTQLLSLEETKKLILKNKILSIAGVEKLLSQLPIGSWIGGSTPYLMSEKGGIETYDQLLVTEFPKEVLRINLRHYSHNDLSSISLHYEPNGFNLMVIPAFGRFHEVFGLNALSTKGLSSAPLIGWISGSDLDPNVATNPVVYNGMTGERFDDKAVVMHAALDPQWSARIIPLNLFKPGSGPVIEFMDSGYEVRDCKIDGDTTNLAEYILQNNINIEGPLVSNFFGSFLNVSFKEVKKEEKRVTFFAPVEKGIKYRIAAAVPDYEKTFEEFAQSSRIPESSEVVWCSNCILNYKYGNLNGKTVASFYGPVTFGEVAYCLLNQTLVSLVLEPTNMGKLKWDT